MLVFKSNSKRHFRKIHPKDDYDITQIKNINFKCYKCPQEFDYYEIFEAHFEETHPNKTLKPENVQLGNTLTTAAKILSMRRKISSNYINSRPIIKPALTKFSQKNDDNNVQNMATTYNDAKIIENPAENDSKMKKKRSKSTFIENHPEPIVAEENCREYHLPHGWLKHAYRRRDGNTIGITVWAKILKKCNLWETAPPNG